MAAAARSPGSEDDAVPAMPCVAAGGGNATGARRIACPADSSDEVWTGDVDVAGVPLTSSGGSSPHPWEDHVEATHSQHRAKIGPSPYPFNACVARPVGKADIARSDGAREALRAEWDRLRSKDVWDESVVREWADVAKEAQAAGEEVDFGYLHAICVEKIRNSLMETHKRSSRDELLSRATGFSIRVGKLPRYKI